MPKDCFQPCGECRKVSVEKCHCSGILGCLGQRLPHGEPELGAKPCHGRISTAPVKNISSPAAIAIVASFSAVIWENYLPVIKAGPPSTQLNGFRLFPIH